MIVYGMPCISFVGMSNSVILKYRNVLCARVDGVGSDTALLNVDESVMIDVRCQYTLTMQLTAAADAAASDNASITIDAVVLIPDYRLSRAYTDAGMCTHSCLFAVITDRQLKRESVSSHHYRRHAVTVVIWTKTETVFV